MNPIKRAAQIVGTQRKLAKLLGVSASAVSQWAPDDVPAHHCPVIERLTAGAVRCETIQPAVDWAYLRATDCAAPKVGAGDTAPQPHQEVI